MSERSPVTIELVIFLLILALALGLRLGNLGAAPLTEAEADQALRAYDLAGGQAPDLGDQPGYVLLTGMTFALVGSSNFLARFWPALLGSALVLLPYALRERLGRQAALLLALALAIAPEFVSASRSAFGLMLGLALPLLALWAWSCAWSVLAGFLAALALLSGPSVYVGLLVAGVAWLLLRILDRRGDLNRWLGGQVQELAARAIPKRALMAFGATLILLATFFLRAPQGLAGLGGSLAAFLVGWVQPSGVPASHLVLAMLGYSLPAFLLGALGAVRAWRESDVFGRALSLWALAGLLVLFLYPGRQVGDLIWVTPPFWALAAQEVARALHLPRFNRIAAVGALALLSLLLIFVTLDLAGAARLDPTTEFYARRLFLAGGSLLLGALALFLIAFGWSGEAASLGLLWTLSLFSVLALIASSMRIRNTGATNANELLGPRQAAGQADLFVETLTDLSMFQTGREDELEVVVQSESRALRWVLRDWPNARQDRVLGAAQQPPVIVTDGLDNQPNQLAAYRGQDFVWAQSPDWVEGWPPNPIAWLIFREGPTRQTDLGLWARTDLFPGSSEVPTQDEEQ